MATTHRLCIDRHRRRTARPEVPEDPEMPIDRHTAASGPDPERAALGGGIGEALGRALRTLSPRAAPRAGALGQTRRRFRHQENPFMKPIVSILAALTFALPALAQDADVRRHPAFVDGSAFVDLAGEDGDLVEVSIGPALLSAITSPAAKEDPRAASVLAGLKGIYAYVVGLENDPVREEKARRLAVDIESRLTRDRWERVVRVREKGERVNVFTKPGRQGESKVDGLVVIVFDGEGSEVVFVNLVGTIDLAQLGAISEELDIPGLDAAAPEAK